MTVEIDIERAIVKVNGQERDLTPKCRAILTLLAKEDGRVVSREKLMADVWGVTFQPSDSRTVDQHIARLRKSLGVGSVAVVSVVGQGYRAVGVTFTRPPLCPAAMVEAIKRGFDKKGKPYAVGQVRWNHAAPTIKKGSKLLEIA